MYFCETARQTVFTNSIFFSTSLILFIVLVFSSALKVTPCFCSLYPYYVKVFSWYLGVWLLAPKATNFFLISNDPTDFIWSCFAALLSFSHPLSCFIFPFAMLLHSLSRSVCSSFLCFSDNFFYHCRVLY